MNMDATIIDLELVKFFRESAATRKEMARCFAQAIWTRVEAADRGKVIQFPRRAQ
jgi:hypothetical protein